MDRATNPQSDDEKHKGISASSDSEAVNRDDGNMEADLADESGHTVHSPLPGSDEPPDGGIVAWLVVFGAWCTSFCSFGWINSKYKGRLLVDYMVYIDYSACLGMGIFQEYYQEELLRQYSPSTISWIPSLQAFFISAMVCF
jgi:hypothetical protein